MAKQFVSGNQNWSNKLTKSLENLYEILDNVDDSFKNLSKSSNSSTDSIGNFNASIKNAAVYDLFAVKDQFKTTLRVKGVRLDKNLVGNLLYAVKKNGEMFLNLKKGTRKIASTIIFFDILDSPTVLSVNVIGTSFILKLFL